MGGPTCPGCYGQDWQFVDHVEFRERWPLERGQIEYACTRCGRRAVRTWIDPHGSDPNRPAFRDSWEFPT
ncbi:hypothetical protein ACFL59_05660 [Planctomycetota bacterium]